MNSNDSNTDMSEKMSHLDYTDIELEIGYSKNQEYETEIEREHNSAFIDAKIEDSVNNVYEKTEKAFKKITQDTKKDHAISQVLKAFDLPDDYTQLEVELPLKIIRYLNLRTESSKKVFLVEDLFAFKFATSTPGRYSSQFGQANQKNVINARRLTFPPFSLSHRLFPALIIGCA